MSFHGGLLGIIVASILFAKKNNQNPFLYMDQIALVAPIGIFFGRIANFINSELYGSAYRCSMVSNIHSKLITYQDTHHNYMRQF